MAIGAQQQTTWTSITDLEGLAGEAGVSRLLRPSVGNQAGLDALFWDASVRHHRPLDCSVRADHGIHAQGLANAMRALGWAPQRGFAAAGTRKRVGDRTEIKYFWVVPEHRYRGGMWRRPRAVKADSDSAPEAKAAMAHVRQFALCIPAATLIIRLANKLDSGVPSPGDLVKQAKDAASGLK